MQQRTFKEGCHVPAQHRPLASQLAEAGLHVEERQPHRDCDQDERDEEGAGTVLVKQVGKVDQVAQSQGGGDE